MPYVDSEFEHAHTAGIVPSRVGLLVCAMLACGWGALASATVPDNDRAQVFSTSEDYEPVVFSGPSDAYLRLAAETTTTTTKEKVKVKVRDSEGKKSKIKTKTTTTSTTTQSEDGDEDGGGDSIPAGSGGGSWDGADGL